MCIYSTLEYGEDNIVGPSHPQTWDLLNYTGSIAFSLMNGLDPRIKGQIFSIIYKSLNLWAMDEKVRGVELAPNLVYGLIQMSLFPLSP